MSAQGWQLLYACWFVALLANQVPAIGGWRRRRLGFSASLRMLVPHFNLFSSDRVDPDYLVVCRGHDHRGEPSEWQSCAPDLSRQFWHALWNPGMPMAVSPAILVGEMAVLAQRAKGGPTEAISPFDESRRIVQLPAACYLSLPYLVLLEMAERRVRGSSAQHVEFAVIRSNGAVSPEPTVILLSGKHAI